MRCTAFTTYPGQHRGCWSVAPPCVLQGTRSPVGVQLVLPIAFIYLVTRVTSWFALARKTRPVSQCTTALAGITGPVSRFLVDFVGWDVISYHWLWNCEGCQLSEGVLLCASGNALLPRSSWKSLTWNAFACWQIVFFSCWLMVLHVIGFRDAFAGRAVLASRQFRFCSALLKKWWQIQGRIRYLASDLKTLHWLSRSKLWTELQSFASWRPACNLSFFRLKEISKTRTLSVVCLPCAEKRQSRETGLMKFNHYFRSVRKQFCSNFALVTANAQISYFPRFAWM